MKFNTILSFLTLISTFSCMNSKKETLAVFETSQSGNQLTELSNFDSGVTPSSIQLNFEQKFQTISGFGGAFTEASAHLLNQMSSEKRAEILDAYFSRKGANYSLTRTHMNSCDFSLSNYSYTPVEGDKNLEHFSIDEDREDLLPMIKDALATSEDGFKLFASPWTAAPWMKDNNKWVGGKLLPEYYDTWALFFSKYADAYKQEGIDIWGFTVENEPLGNGDNWESMHFTPEEMTDFVQHHLGPKLEADGKGDLKILGYDQNRQEIKEWVDVMYKDEASSKYYDGTAIHWYESTYDFFPEALQYAHQKAHSELKEKEMYEEFIRLTSDNKASEMAVSIIGYYINDDVIRYDNAKRYQEHKKDILIEIKAFIEGVTFAVPSMKVIDDTVVRNLILNTVVSELKKVQLD